VLKDFSGAGMSIWAQNHLQTGDWKLLRAKYINDSKFLEHEVG